MMDLRKLSETSKELIAEEISSSDTLDELADDLSPKVRLAVAKRECAKISTLERLAKDEVEEVSRAADETLTILLYV